MTQFYMPVSFSNPVCSTTMMRTINAGEPKRVYQQQRIHFHAVSSTFLMAIAFERLT
jgi:hypothetical protein